MGEKGGKDTKGTKLKISAKAAADVENIFKFIAIDQEKPLTAQRVRKKIFEKIKKIGIAPYANKPLSGPNLEGRDIRQGIVMSWIIIYEITENSIEIYKVIHRSKCSVLLLE